jgi:hypothetical protein
MKSGTFLKSKSASPRGWRVEDRDYGHPQTDDYQIKNAAARKR